MASLVQRWAVPVATGKDWLQHSLFIDLLVWYFGGFWQSCAIQAVSELLQRSEKCAIALTNLAIACFCIAGVISTVSSITGAEEFIVVLEGQDTERARHLAEQLRTLIHENELVPDRSLTIPLGVAALSRMEPSEDRYRSTVNRLLIWTCIPTAGPECKRKINTLTVNC